MKIKKKNLKTLIFTFIIVYETLLSMKIIIFMTFLMKKKNFFFKFSSKMSSDKNIQKIASLIPGCYVINMSVFTIKSNKRNAMTQIDIFL